MVLKISELLIYKQLTYYRETCKLNRSPLKNSLPINKLEQSFEKMNYHYLFLEKKIVFHFYLKNNSLNPRKVYDKCG